MRRSSEHNRQLSVPGSPGNAKSRVPLAAWATLLALAAAATSALGDTALDDYIAEPPTDFSWSHHSTINGTGYKGYVLDMTSQTWRSLSEVNRNEWEHWVTVIVPDGAPIDTALLCIGGGSNGGSPPTGVDSALAAGAIATNSVIVTLPTVPNQPLRFSDDLQWRSEDEIIAYTFNKYINEGGDEYWPLLLPMVKSAVRAMDATQAFLLAAPGGAVEVNDFVVTGGSKRGWTTWLTGAADPRVRGIIPVVIDVLNIDEQMVHHKKFYEGVTEHMYGGYAEAISDYVEYGIPDDLGTPEAQALLEIVDPYEYRDRYADMPKYVLNATGDEFFVPDSAQFYFDDLPGEKHLRYVPNSGHGISGATGMTMQYYNAIVTDADMPEFSWTLEDGGREIHVDTVDTPTQVKLWQASNTESRDYRWYSGSGPHWSDSILSDLGGGEYVGEVPVPATGSTAFMIELTFDGGYVFTTQVTVVERSGDFDRDEDVDAFDLLIWQNGYESGSTFLEGDADGNGTVDGFDLLIWQNQYDAGPSSVPEPSALALLGAAGLALLGLARRRR
jgi:PhoPQ-activated pathogenicity-related protein